MKTNFFLFQRQRRAFTLIELLVVIAIIGILAAMLFPAIAKIKERGKIMKARAQISDILTGINAYDAHYHRFPVSSNAQISATSLKDDFTFGGTFKIPGGTYTIPTPSPAYIAENNEVVGILQNLTTYRNGQPTRNPNNTRNPQKVGGISGEEVAGTTQPGIGEDGVFRDPWGNPYIISVDLNFNEKCRDAFYRLQQVSQPVTPANSPNGLNGLFNAVNNTGASDDFEFNGPVMVWSAGPDKMIDPTAKANVGANKDNILSWKP